jgi:hypothetical protein
MLQINLSRSVPDSQLAAKGAVESITFGLESISTLVDKIINKHDYERI